MQTQRLSRRSPLLLLSLVLPLALLACSGCTTVEGWFSNPNSTAAIQTATTLAVGEAILSAKTQPAEKSMATNIVSVANQVSAAANGTVTVAQLVAIVEAKVAALNLSPQEQLAAQTLMAFASSELQAKVSTGLLKPQDVVIVTQFCGWVVAAATPYANS
jgi:hypothetical protein